MIRIARTVLACALLAGCAAPVSAPAPRVAASASSPEAAELIRVTEALFAAMESRDTVAIRRAFAPDARLVDIRVSPGAAPRVRSRTVSEFVRSMGSATAPLRERMWDPQVQVGEQVAALWAPYDFYIGDRFSHCGHDAVHFARMEDGWKVVAITFTTQTTGCPPGPPRG